MVQSVSVASVLARHRERPVAGPSLTDPELRTHLELNLSDCQSLREKLRYNGLMVQSVSVASVLARHRERPVAGPSLTDPDFCWAQQKSILRV